MASFRVTGSSARFAALSTMLLGMSLFCACQRHSSEATVVLDGRTMGTEWRVELVVSEAWGSARVDSFRGDIEKILEGVDRGMSTWRADSTISRFNVDPAATSWQLDSELARVVDAALRLAEKTGGAFDPTIGPMVAMWGFGAGAMSEEPSKSDLDEARARVGWEKLAISRSGLLVRNVRGVELDLSGFAKGEAVDRLMQRSLEEQPLGALVDIGGEIRVSGRSIRGDRWRLGIDLPVDGEPGGAGLAGVVELSDRALATSGDYRQRRFAEGRWISHIIDPRSGMPANSSVASASVLAADCATADGVATALVVFGAEDGLQWIEARPEIEALLILHTESGELEIVRSSGWPGGG